MKTINKTLLFISSVTLGLLFFCNYPETTFISNSEFTLPTGNDTIYQFTKRYYILSPDDSAFFCGTDICTTIYNGDVKSIENDSLYFAIKTLSPKFILVDNGRVLVFPQMFYQPNHSKTKLNDEYVIRYMVLSDTAILQLAYNHKEQQYIVDKRIRKVLPTTIEVGSFDTVFSSNNQWPASPLIVNPISSKGGTIWFDGYSYASKGLALIPGEEYKINGVDSLSYSYGVAIKTYYSISGNSIENDAPVKYLGSIEIVRNYFKDVGLVDQKSTVTIQRVFANGKLEIKKRHTYLARPSQAKIFTDFNERIITILSPNGGEKWQSDKEYKISWKSVGHLPYVKLQYTVDDGSKWEIIANNISNTGVYNWNIPDVISDSCRIQISDPDNNHPDISDNIFSLYR